MGMANPHPSLTPELLAMAVLMPITSPRMIDQRSAAIARIDGGVGLQEILISEDIFAQLQIPPPFAADNAVRERLVQPEGTAHGQHKVADFHLVAVAQRRGHQIRTRIWT